MVTVNSQRRSSAAKAFSESFDRLISLMLLISINWHDYCYFSKVSIVHNYWEKTVTSNISTITDLLEAGIKAENLRQKAIAGNVANLETPGYHRFDVRFDELLAKALDSSEAVDIDEIEPQIYRPMQTPVKSNGNDVNLEAEVGEMVKNILRYKAYIRLLNKKYNQLELAMNMNER
jgi:flagellar basal-body rod protein FlgB